MIRVAESREGSRAQDLTHHWLKDRKSVISNRLEETVSREPSTQIGDVRGTDFA